jgi:uncharacterized protein YkwD
MIRHSLWIAAFLTVVTAIARADDAQDCLKAHNRIRKEHALAPLRLDKRLSVAAQKHADHMAKNLKLHHRGPGEEMYFDRALAAGYQTDWETSSENIAEGPEDFMDAAFTTQAWLESTVGHKDNVLSREWRDLGVGVARGSDGRLYWCAVYARPQTSQRTPRSAVRL